MSDSSLTYFFFCLYISRTFYLFLKVWHLASFYLNMDNSSVSPYYHHHQSLFSLFILHFFYRFDYCYRYKSSCSYFSLRYRNYSWVETSVLSVLASPSTIISDIILSLSLFPWALIQLLLEFSSVSFLLHGFHCG